MEIYKVLILLSVIAVSQCTTKNDVNELERTFNEIYDNLDIDELSTYKENDEDGNKHYFPIPPFECDVSSEYEPATTVHALRPSDIKVMAALGDSITAGYGVGADTLPAVVINNRGFSWDIGGNETLNTSLTLPNIFKKYNEDVTGWSWSRPVVTERNDSHCGNFMHCEQLNVARGGATNRDMKSQAEHLVEKLLDNNKTEGDINFNIDWKVVTLFIGGNDLCRICSDWESYNPETYRDGIQDALDVFHGQLNRTLVQVVLMFDITPLENVSTGAVCDALHWSVCPCSRREDSKPLLKGYQMEYARLIEELVNSGRYDTRNDFTVVVQPHYRDLGPVLTEDGEVDNSYFSPDCFHFSQKAHQGTAMMLWNVMLMPVGHKPYEYDLEPENHFRCPTEEYPFIFTNLNSDVDWIPGKYTQKKHIKYDNTQIDLSEQERAFYEMYAALENDLSLTDEWYTSKENDEDGNKHYFPIPPFECDVSPEHEPAKTVHELRPDDIQVMAALGDSITAAFGVGADTIAGVLINNRGFSWSIGGNETLNTSLTLPNIFKQYNEDVTGWSWSRPVITERNDSHCGNFMYCEQLNVAIGGATNRGMKNQAESLVGKLLDNNKTEGDIDFNNDWKVVTLFIGGNDLCRICNNWEAYGPETYRDGIRDALDVFHAELNRTLVQVVLVFDITPLENVSTGADCDALHWVACPCAKREDAKPLLKGYQMEYARLIEELVNSGRYDTRDDFTVVVQPHYRDMGPVLTEDGEVDNSYFSPDCFHFSQKAHQGTAMMLWNVMLTPVGQKPYKYDVANGQYFRCPTEEYPYIFTNLNSDVDWNPGQLPRRMGIAKYNGDNHNSKGWDRFQEIIDDEEFLLDNWEELAEEEDDEYFPIPPFECEVLPEYEPATNVHELKPSDVSVMAAMGDSITAGNGCGANTLPGVAVENRGHSWCIGGNQTLNTSLTLPNLIKQYNPDVNGWSWSREVRSHRNDSHCGNAMYCSQLNAAEPGGTNNDMLSQAENIIEKLKDNNQTDGDIDFDNDWKVISMFVGGNDLCAICDNWEEYSPEAYRDGIQEGLDKLHAEVPRALVQVILYFDITPLENVSTGIVCDGLQWGFCACARREDTKPLLKGYQMEYSRLIEELVDSGRYDTRDDFTVVVQPHHRDMGPMLDENGDIDHSYFAPDCFHFSQKAHQGEAYMLWNVMLMPVGQKPYKYDAYEESIFRCPTEEYPYIFTNLNSDVDWNPDTGLTKGRTTTLNVHKHETAVKKTSREIWDEKVSRLNAWLEAEPSRMEEWLNRWEAYEDDGIDIPLLTCDTTPPENKPEPQSVHELTPFDIRVIASFGDSITAGNGVGANNLPAVAIENRGESWNVGGNQTYETILTIPNILREFNLDLQGWSYSRDPGFGNEDRNKTHCGLRMECAQLNVADPGATNDDMPDQADDLIVKTKNHSEIDWQNDWKIVFLFIGGNDLCAVCRKWDDYNPQNYMNNIKIALDKIKAALPRTMVHVISMFDVAPLSNYSTGTICNIMHMEFCDCAVYNDTVQSMMRPIQYAYWELLDELINVNGTYDGDDDFTVVLQPHMRDMDHPKTDEGEWDSSFLAPDCFHPSRKAHQTMAYQLWNMLLTPVPEKPFQYPKEDQKAFMCPSEDAPYIFTNDNSRALQIREEEEEDPDDTLPIPPFECVVEPHEPAANVHSLRPNDIRVVASFGDSITAGNGLGADRAAGVAIENRGESWSVGGNQTLQTILTIPNLIKEFNPEVTGWSWSRDTRNERNETYCSENMVCSQLNVAEPGATNRGMDEQAQVIIDRLKDTNFTKGDIDYDNDWKMITLFIGGNDLCRVCENWDSYSPESYRDGIQEALDTLHAEVPRAIVNLVVMFDISPLKNISDRLLCDAVQFGFCKCAVLEESVEQLKSIQYEYAILLEELVNSGRYDTRDDFTVVLQPHMRDIQLPLDENGWYDASYFSEDCFHPSRKGHHGMALMLWNVMFEPVGQKTYAYDVNQERRFRCPSEEWPYIFTNKNSDVNWSSERSWLAGQLQQREDTDFVRAHYRNIYDNDDRVPPGMDYVPEDTLRQEVNAAYSDSSSADDTNASGSGVAITLVAIIGLLVLALGLTMVVPYWRKTRKHGVGSQPSFENPGFEYDINME